MPLKICWSLLQLLSDSQRSVRMLLLLLLRVRVVLDRTASARVRAEVR
jgi:hypothetical protein